ncbi:hypothetical protein BKA65DRAFT_501129 [Rhexocercosporidium sp. MPI-PUGE-AT-0058]|nr:hypothetical protein BKA65DRAFT_501129 [Rhexocercosporidium sp. MPI-PUGE-AT-0058]
MHGFVVTVSWVRGRCRGHAWRLHSWFSLLSTLICIGLRECFQEVPRSREGGLSPPDPRIGELMARSSGRGTVM